MAGEQSPAIASEAEIELALAEAEAKANQIPSLDDGRSPRVVHVPVESPPLPRPEQTRPRSDAAWPAPPTEATPDSAHVAPAADPPQKKPRLSWLGHAPYRTLDVVLWLVNWPFRGLSPRARHLAGLLAIATLISSLLALLLLPAPFRAAGRPAAAAANVAVQTPAASAAH